MKIINLDMKDFDVFAEKNPLKNYCQTSGYAKIMAEKGYFYDFIGYQDTNNQIVAAALILTKNIDEHFKYAYSPRGFLIDYYNTELLNNFIKDISIYLENKDISFLKINPEIIIGEIDARKGFVPIYNQNVKIIDDLKKFGFRRRKEIEPLTLMLPRLNPSINMKDFDINNIINEIKDKINFSTSNGLKLEKGSNNQISILYEFIKNNTNETIGYYENILNVFGNDSAELFLIKVDDSKCILNNPNEEDDKLLSLKNILSRKNNTQNKEKNHYIGGALVIKYANKVSVIVEGYDNNYSSYYPEVYLQYSLIEKFKKNFDYLYLNGLAGNFSTDSKYYNYNKDRLSLVPDINEYIGEFDLILNDREFENAQYNGLLTEEFISSIKI